MTKALPSSSSSSSGARTALWLLGDARIAASPSPLLHNAFTQLAHHEDRYSLHPDDDAARAFAAAEAVCRGVNVTAPHKVKAFERYRGVADERALACGAVNTVVFGDDGKATAARNTDVHGLLTGWRRAGLIVEGRSVVVVGAGGAARATVVAAAEAGAKDVVVWARRKDAAASLVALAATVKLDAAVADVGARASLVVVAASDLDDKDVERAVAFATPGGCVHDLRYGERSWPVRNCALRNQRLFVDGSTMLLAQAEEAAALFAGRALDDVERRAMSQALAQWLRRPR